MAAFFNEDHMGERMTESEQKYIDKCFEEVKGIISNLKEAFENFVKSQNNKTKDQQIQIIKVHAQANENKIEIIKIQGKIETLEAIKNTEDKTEKEIKTESDKNKEFKLKKSHIILGIIGLLIAQGTTIILSILFK